MNFAFARKRSLLPASALLLMLLGGISAGATGQEATSPVKPSDNDPVLHALCGKRVVLLGESPIHGFGNTLEFKVQLVRRLVDECHFNALIMESGVYDFIHIERTLASGEDVSEPMIAAAIGGLWANKEVQALVPFLKQKVSTGKLTLGGMDDQLGAGTYASKDMASDLVPLLPGKERSRCLAILQRHLLWQYTDAAPYGPSDKEKIVGCLNELQDQLASAPQKTSLNEQSRVMVASLQRDIARDFTENDFTKPDQTLKWFNDRDRSMDVNFEWLRERLPRGSKIIVWAASVHTAKDLSEVPGFEGRVPLGSYIHRELGDQAFSLAFSAYTGEYAFTHQPVRKLSEAPPASLEARLFSDAGTDTRYLSREQLNRYGAVEARPLGTDFKTAHWDRVFDGMVIFRKERAPDWIKPVTR